MASGRLTRAILHALDAVARLRERVLGDGLFHRSAHGDGEDSSPLPPLGFKQLCKHPPVPAHLQLGAKGEEEAYFHLRKQGYVMVARNFRCARLRGEIDLIGWDENILCFIEVKTRSSREIKPAEAAVDHLKKKDICAVARGYLRRLPEIPPFRFDVVTIYYEGKNTEITLFKNSFQMS